MRIRAHILQHVPFEGPGIIGSWLESRGAHCGRTRLFLQETLPDIDAFDWLIVMGGPMSANDERQYSWLTAEKRLVAAATESSKVVLGVCLGAQLIASALGARVYANGEREVGWFPVHRVSGALSHPIGSLLPEWFDAFHWHGDTFELPAGAAHLARSAACAHQAFAVGERVLGLQFHLEMTMEAARGMIDSCREDLKPGRWVQSERAMLGSAETFERGNRVMAGVLDFLEAQA